MRVVYVYGYYSFINFKADKVFLLGTCMILTYIQSLPFPFQGGKENCCVAKLQRSQSKAGFLLAILGHDTHTRTGQKAGDFGFQLLW